MNTPTAQLILALTAIAPLLLSGCGMRETRVQHGDREQILHLGNGTEPQDLDPHIVTGVPESNILRALLEGLVTNDPRTMQPVPAAAQRWDISEDHRVYTFHLREDGRWSNGKPVTAQDFVNSYRRMLAPELAAEYAYMLYVIENAEAFNKEELTDFNQVGVKALDDHTLEVRLNNPTPYFLSLLNHTSWWPVHLPTIEQHGPAFERGNRWTRPGNHVGNGPFVLQDWRVNQFIIVKKNPHYWDADAVRLQAIHFYPIDSQDTEERAFRSGQLHITQSVPLTRIPVYQERNPDLLRMDPYLGTYFYRFNTTRPPLDNPKIRRALSLAIDREMLVERVTRGGEIPAHHFTPPGTGGFHARARVASDIEAARQLLADAGHPSGQGLPAIDILFNTHENHRIIAEAIQQMWNKNLNINARLRNEEWKVYLNSQRNLNYQVSRSGWIGDYDDPNTFLDMWVTDGGQNHTGWSNAEYDRLIRLAGQATDPAERFEIFQQAEAILLEELPVMPIYFYTRVFLISPSVRGWEPNILDHHPYKHVWLEPLGG